MIFGRTDLRIGLSKAKFGAESDFEVRLGVAPPKPAENAEKLISETDFVFRFFFASSKNRKLQIVRNVRCRSFTLIGAILRG